MSTKPRSSAGEKVVDVRTTELTADVSCSDVLRSVVRTGPTRWSPAMNSAPAPNVPTSTEKARSAQSNGWYASVGPGTHGLATGRSSTPATRNPTAFTTRLPQRLT